MAGCPHTPCARDGLWRGPASGKIEGNSNSNKGDSDRGGSRDREWRDRVGKESRSQGSMSFQTAGKVVPGAGAGPPQPENTNANIPPDWAKNPFLPVLRPECVS